MLKIFVGISLLLFLYGIQKEECAELINAFRSNNKPIEAIKIVYVGEIITIECYSCDIKHLQWTYKPRNGAQEELIKRNKTIRSRNPKKGTEWFDLVSNSTTCAYHLLLNDIQFDSAGVYSCWDNTAELRIRNVIVITENHSCFIEEFPDSKNLFLNQNDSVTIKCPFQYSADESCIVTPIWTDLTGYRNFMIPAQDFAAKMNDKHAWINFRAGAKLKNGTQFSLSFDFNCSSFKNNSHDKHILALYDYGHIPYTYLAGDIPTEVIEKVSIAFDPLLIIWVAITTAAISILALSLLVVCLKHHKKLCFAYSRQEHENLEVSVLGKPMPEVPMDVGYRNIDKELQVKDVRFYEVIDDGAYEAIAETSETTTL